MNIGSIISEYKMYIALAGAAVIFILFLLVIIQAVKIKKLNKKYNSFITGNDGKSLEELILTRFQEVDDLKGQMESMTEKMTLMNETLLMSYQKMSIVKYDAFKEMGGKLSFAMALLNDSNSGFIINSMHSSREGCYTYIKEIIRGESFVVLSDEEKEALERAINYKNYMQ